MLWLRLCADTTVSGSEIAALDMRPIRGISALSYNSGTYQTRLMLQSSHSSTGFHPSRLAQTSHFALNSVLENNSSRGLHKASVEREGDWLRLCPPSDSRPLPPRFEPGLMRVNRWTIGMVDPRIVDPPSVALASDIILDEDAV